MSKFSSLALAVDKSQRMTLLHPVSMQPLRDKDGKEAYIELYSSDSSVSRKHGRTVTQRQFDQRGRKLQVVELEANEVDLLAALTVDWYLVDLEGEPLGIEFTPANARELYATDDLVWIKEQVNRFSADRANFSKASS